MIHHDSSRGRTVGVVLGVNPRDWSYTVVYEDGEVEDNVVAERLAAPRPERRRGQPIGSFVLSLSFKLSQIQSLVTLALTVALPGPLSWVGSPVLCRG